MDGVVIVVALQDGRVFEALLVGSDTLTDLAEVVALLRGEFQKLGAS